MFSEQKLPSIEVGPTALAWPTTSTLTYDLHLQSPASYGHAKVQGQRSVGSEDRMETNGPTDGQTDGGRTDGGECITSHANAVGN